MKKGDLSTCAAAGLVVLVVLTGCATTGGKGGDSAELASFYVPAVGEELFGTWVNPDLTPPTFPQKLVLYPWGLLESFNSADSTLYDWRATATIVRRWKDAAGNTWYWDYQRWAIKDSYGAAVYALHRVSSDEQTLETIGAGAGWLDPADLDPDQNTSYAKYRRQQ